MKAFLCLALFVAAVFAEDKQPEKRAVLGYGYGGLPGYAGLPAVAAASTYHGIGAYPYSSHLGYAGLPYTHAGLHAPAIIPKVAAPLAYPGALGYGGYASALHAPLVAKTVSPFGYSSPYLGYGHGLPLYH